VLFGSRKVPVEDPQLKDVTVSILRIFGIAPTSGVSGRDRRQILYFQSTADFPNRTLIENTEYGVVLIADDYKLLIPRTHPPIGC
jgi:ABC-type proline/glycine betaine transport system ATPase subunit